MHAVPETRLQEARQTMCQDNQADLIKQKVRLDEMAVSLGKHLAPERSYGFED